MPEFIQSGTATVPGRLNRTRFLSHDALCLAVLACLNVAFFAEVLFTDRTFFVRDVSTFHYPLKKLVTEAYSRGEWPLWNPYLQMGQPLLANPNSMAVYPGQLLFQFLPFETAFEFHFVIHCALAGMGAFCLARTLGFSRQAALLSAVIYNFSGLTQSSVNLFNILPVVAFLPWLSVALLRLVSRPSASRGCFTALLLGCFFLLLEPLSTLATALFLFVLIGAFVWQSGQANSSLLRLAGIAVVVLATAISLAAVQIVPALELVQFSGRKGGLSFSEATFWSLHPVQLLQALCPRIFGEYFRLEAPVPWPTRFFGQREPYLLSCYVGLMSLSLAVWGAWRSRSDWRTKSLAVAMGLSILLALGLHTPLYSSLFAWIPIFRYGRFPVKFLFVSNLCVALLAGTGWANLQDDASHFRKGRQRAVVLLAALSALLAAFYGESAWKLLGAVRNAAGEFQWSLTPEPVRVGANLIFGGLRHVHFHLGILSGLLLLRNWRVLRSNLLGVALLLFVLLDLWNGTLWINPPGDSKLYETAPVARYLQERQKSEGPFRIYRFEPARLSEHPSIRYETDSVIWISLYRKLTLFPFLGAKDHVEYSLFPSIDRLETPFVQQLSRELEKAAGIDERLDLLSGLNVRYILSPVELKNDRLRMDALFQVNSDQPLRLYELQEFTPRVFVVSPPPERANASIPRADASFVVQTTGLNQLRVMPGKPLAGTYAKVTNYFNGKVDLEVESLQGGLLVLLDNDYPGWVASVDAETRPIQVIHPASRAVGVPGGKHRVAFRYAPPSFRRGLMISSVALLLVAATLGTCLVTRLRTARPVSEE